MSAIEQDQKFWIRPESDDYDDRDFEHPDDFWTTKSFFNEQGIAHTVEVPDWYEMDAQDTADTQAETDGGENTETEILDHPENGDSQVQKAEVVDAQPEKPDRKLTDDPIQWIKDAGNFTYKKNGKTAINKKGLRVLQHWYDIDNPESEVLVGPEETDHTYCRVRAKAEMPDGRRAVAHGSAHVDRGDDPWLLVEMADTRAKSRVLLDITGMGAVAVSEIQNEL